MNGKLHSTHKRHSRKKKLIQNGNTYVKRISSGTRCKMVYTGTTNGVHVGTAFHEYVARMSVAIKQTVVACLERLHRASWPGHLEASLRERYWLIKGKLENEENNDLEELKSLSVSVSVVTEEDERTLMMHTVLSSPVHRCRDFE